MALLDGKTAPASVVSMEDADVGLISKEVFEKHLLSKEKVVKQLNSMLCSRLRESWLKIKVLSFADAEQKLRAVLKLLGDQVGISDMRGKIIPLRMTHQDIADYASISRETVTRIIDRLSKDQEVEVLSNKNILLKPPFFKNTAIL
jgi:CRP/FNR family transcriptional regulator